MRATRGLLARGLAAGALLLAEAGAARADEAAKAAPAAEQGGEAGAKPKGDAPEASRPARPALPPEPQRTKLPWGRHIEIGGSVALAFRPASTGSVRYRPAVGYGVHARWDMLRYVRFTGYLVRAHHRLELFHGALGGSEFDGRTVDPDAEVWADKVDTLAFGARLGPQLPIGARARAWLATGIGYGRFDFGEMFVCEEAACRWGSARWRVHERGASFAEVPISLGASFDVIRSWLAIEIEVSGAFVLGQGGEAFERAQAIDLQGRRREVGPMPKVDGSFVNTLGLSLVL